MAKYLFLNTKCFLFSETYTYMLSDLTHIFPYILYFFLRNFKCDALWHYVNSSIHLHDMR